MAALALSCAVLLSGCQVGNIRFVFIEPIGPREVFKIDHEVCKDNEARLYLANYANIYGNAYGAKMWKQESKVKQLESYVKEMAISQLARIKCLNGIAKEKEIELSTEEERKAKEAAKKYYESLSDKEREYLEIEETDIELCYQEYWRAAKAYQSLTGEINEEVSDDEARVMEAMQIFVADQSLAQEVKKRLGNGEDFATVASACNEKDKTEITFGREEMPPEVEAEAFELEDGEVTGAIKAADGYYFIKCIDKYNQELTDQNKKAILEEREEQAFHDVYDEYVSGISTVFNEKLWEHTDAGQKKGIGTDSFFEVIDQAMGF